MKTLPHADDIDRTALLSAHDGSQPTLEAAIRAHETTGVTICADSSTCTDALGQAALLTALVTAVRAFGNTVVVLDSPEAEVTSGIFTGQRLCDVVHAQGARMSTDQGSLIANPVWPTVLIGPRSVPPKVDNGATSQRIVLRASWNGWVAKVHASDAPQNNADKSSCVLAAIAAGGLGISEAFAAARSIPGCDAGFRHVSLDLWTPAEINDQARPSLAFAPKSWWLIGLGHLGQAYAWTISWIPYTDRSAVEIVLQDTDLTTRSNFSTGVLTPRESRGVLKTRLVAKIFDEIGFVTRIIERRLGSDQRVAESDDHVALVGVDNLDTRRLISKVGWLTAIDVGLGSGPANFSSILLRRFPGREESGQVAAWTTTALQTAIPQSPAFNDLSTRGDNCGMIEIAGKAVGAAFVGVISACIAVAEATRELHGGRGHDILNFDLTTFDLRAAQSSHPANIITTRL
ncbi:hypothetical protein [Sphaerisporangium sp. NPDC051011]|uniref:hypothetical protein n=1 Tax=Sphaerisporangium sp. NPDC051011 TaxID=3155792 RepID=UPI0033CBD7B2